MPYLFIACYIYPLNDFKINFFNNEMHRKFIACMLSKKYFKYLKTRNV